MKMLRLRTFVIFACVVALGAALLQISHRVQEAQVTLAKLEKQLAKEQEALRVLKAEWAFLNSPARLETLAREHLDLKAPDALRLTTGGRALPDSARALPIHEVSIAPETPIIKPPHKPVRRAQQKDFGTLLREVTQ